MPLKIEVIEIRKNFVTISATFLFLANSAFAHCPLCVATTGSAVAVARFLGIPDLITGTFVGAFIISIAAWMNKILKKRKYCIPFQQVVITTLSLSLFIALFFLAGFITALFDKLLIGLLIGILITSIAFAFHDFLREKNGNKNYIPFQVIFITIAFLLITSFWYYVMGLI